MYKVYIQNSLLTIGKKPNRRPDWTIDYYNHLPFDKIIKQLENSPIFLNYHVTTGEDAAEVWEEFKKYFEVIRAAGGIVLNDQGEFLIIKRHGKFDLPKGKVEDFENPEDAAVREVYEECGISGCTLLPEEPLTSYHTYMIGGQRILKETSWFLMNHKGTDYSFKPQAEEGITEVFWLGADKLESIFSNTYPNIKDVLLHFSKK